MLLIAIVRVILSLSLSLSPSLSQDLYTRPDLCVSGTETLGGRVRERLRSEPLDPVFHFMQFEDADERFQDVSLVCSVDNFIDGLNERLATLVHHIEHCISLHGKDTVLAVP